VFLYLNSWFLITQTSLYNARFLDQIILSNPLRKYLFVIIAILLGLLFKDSSRNSLLVYYTGRKFSWISIDKDAFVKLLIDLGNFSPHIHYGCFPRKTSFPGSVSVWNLWISSKTIVHAIAKIILIVVFIWLLMRTIDFIGLLLKQRIHATAIWRIITGSILQRFLKGCHCYYRIFIYWELVLGLSEQILDESRNSRRGTGIVSQRKYWKPDRSFIISLISHLRLVMFWKCIISPAR